MPRRPRPFFDPRTNAWRLRYKQTLPDGTIRRHWHLASGRGKYAQALTKAAQIMGGLPEPETVHTITQAIDAYLVRHPGAYRRRMLCPLNNFAGGMELREVEVRSGFLADYRDYLTSAEWTDVNRRTQTGYAPKSVRGYVGYANALFKWCGHRDRGFMASIPDMPALPTAPKGHRSIPPEKLRAAFARLPERAAAILAFILHTGCRPSEACKLRWEHIDIENRLCRLPPGEHKTGGRTGQDRVLFLTDAALEVVQGQRKFRETQHVFTSRLHRPYTPGGLRKILLRRGIRGAYQLRHTWAQDARRQGLDLGTISAWLGHSTVKTTEIYVQIEQQEARQAAHSLASPLRPPLPGSGNRDLGVSGRRRRPGGRRSSSAG